MQARAGGRPDGRTSSAWQGFLLLVLGALIACLPGGGSFVGTTADSSEISHLEDPFRIVSEAVPAEAPDQGDLETISEQAEDPLVALGHPLLGLEPSAECEGTEHGLVASWAIGTAAFRSSSARGPPRA